MAPFRLLAFLLFFSPVAADLENRLFNEICGGGNYSVNSTFESNLNLALSSLALSSRNSLYSNDTKGLVPDRVYGYFDCCGDVSPSDCYNCVQNAIQDAPKLCGFSKQLHLWYSFCRLRYSDLSFFSSFDDKYYRIYRYRPNATDPDIFGMYVRKLMSDLSNTAGHRSSMFSTGKITYGGYQSEIYGLAQCTRDLSMNTCYRCLQEILDLYWKCCATLKGGGTISMNCYFWYENFKFFKGEPTVSLAPLSESAPDSGNGKGNRHIVSISIVFSVVVAFVLIFTLCILFVRRSAKNRQGIAKPEELSTTESLYFDFPNLKFATSNFADVNKLGEGGFGSVYKGTLPNGEEIAVKRLSADSRQGIEELMNELVLVAKLQHRNLVRLQGVCLEEEEKLLVYEYMPNGSLDKFLFDPTNCNRLNWETRFKIIEGIARGLLYLHEESRLKVIHRDLKASNILLDADMNPKISDFGLARLFGRNETQGITRRVVGTVGYMAPEYARYGTVSTKLDVFSFGILVLEIVTGRKSSSFRDSEHDLLSYTSEHWSNATISEIIHPSVAENSPEDEVLMCIQVALLCAQQVPASRPPMSTVVLMLHSPPVDVQVSVQTNIANMLVEHYSRNELTISELDPR